MAVGRHAPAVGFDEGAERAYRRRLEVIEGDIEPTERHRKRIEEKQRQQEEGEA